MMLGKYTIATRTIAMLAGALFLLAVIGFGVTQCQQRRNAASQARLDAAQGEAGQESAKDAIGSVVAVGGREAASGDITRQNSTEIRNAQGSSDKINPDLRDAGFASLCRRPSFRNSATGKLRCAAP